MVRKEEIKYLRLEHKFCAHYQSIYYMAELSVTENKYESKFRDKYDRNLEIIERIGL